MFTVGISDGTFKDAFEKTPPYKRDSATILSTRKCRVYVNYLYDDNCVRVNTYTYWYLIIDYSLLSLWLPQWHAMQEIYLSIHGQWSN